jgi:hypothetical protein
MCNSNQCAGAFAMHLVFWQSVHGLLSHLQDSSPCIDSFGQFISLRLYYSRLLLQCTGGHASSLCCFDAGNRPQQVPAGDP